MHTQHTTCRCGVHRGLCLAGCPLVHLDLHCTFAHRASTLAKNCGVIWLACSYSFGLIWEQFVVQCLLAAGHFLVRFAHQMTRALGTFLVRWQGAHKGPRVTPRARHFLVRWHRGRPVISQERKSSCAFVRTFTHSFRAALRQGPPQHAVVNLAENCSFRLIWE